MDQIKIGIFLKELRKEKKLTQEQLAEKCELSVDTISHIEANICYAMSLRVIYRIAEALDIEPYQLLKFD